MWYHASQTQYIEYQWFQIGVFVSITLQEYIGVWNLLDQTWDAVLFKWIMRRIRTHTFKQVQWVLAKTSASFGRFSTPLARWCFEISSHFHFYLGNYPIWLVLFKRVETINYMLFFICSFRIYEHGYTKLLHYGFVFLGIVGQQSYIGQNDGTFVPGVNYSILRSKYFCCRHRQIKELSCLFELYRDAIVPTWATIS